MADFLQRDLEREKLKCMKIEDAFVKAKESSMKMTEKERTNTETELQSLKNEVAVIQENAAQNARDAEEAIKV